MWLRIAIRMFHCGSVDVEINGKCAKTRGNNVSCHNIAQLKSGKSFNFSRIFDEFSSKKFNGINLSDGWLFSAQNMIKRMHAPRLQLQRWHKSRIRLQA